MVDFGVSEKVQSIAMVGGDLDTLCLQHNRSILLDKQTVIISFDAITTKH